MRRVLERPSKSVFLFERKRTVPADIAKSVWSVPTPIFLPGSIFVPRCRTIISPIPTFCPSARLTPRYFGFESFRLCAVPPAFVWAIVLNTVYCIRYTVYRIEIHKYGEYTGSVAQNQELGRYCGRGMGTAHCCALGRLGLVRARPIIGIGECSCPRINHKRTYNHRTAGDEYRGPDSGITSGECILLSMVRFCL